MISLNWHRAVYKVLKVFINPFLKYKLNYSYERYIPKSKPYIVLANHNTDYDPFLVGLAFPQQIYYVASEHIFRWGFASKLIELLVAPIPRVKATTEIHTVMEILKKLKAGANVCLFAEGNRSFSGETGEIHPSTGKLIKKSGVSLITFRIDGGYFSSPRWSKTLRKGKVRGRIVREYTPEDLKIMSAKEISQAIERDLYVNAYEEQEKEPIPYIGKKMAENLETALYRCPKCEGISTLKSEEDRLCCNCGLDLNYTHYGYLTSNNNEKPPFETILDWCRWQDIKIAEETDNLKQMPTDKPIFSDDGQTLYQIVKAKKSKVLGTGSLLFYSDRMIFDCGGNKLTFKLKDISDLAIHGQMVIIFSTTERESYEIKSDHPRSALKYFHLFRALKI